MEHKICVLNAIKNKHTYIYIFKQTYNGRRHLSNMNQLNTLSYSCHVNPIVGHWDCLYSLLFKNKFCFHRLKLCPKYFRLFSQYLLLLDLFQSNLKQLTIHAIMYRVCSYNHNERRRVL